jgi:hypothetical protein
MSHFVCKKTKNPVSLGNFAEQVATLTLYSDSDLLGGINLFEKCKLDSTLNLF